VCKSCAGRFYYSFLFVLATLLSIVSGRALFHAVHRVCAGHDRWYPAMSAATKLMQGAAQNVGGSGLLGMSEKAFGTLMDIVIQSICAAAVTIGSRLVPNR
jgi:hypothetical protein